MILTCELCQSQFLTESDPHVVIPGPETKIYCYCQVKGNEQKWIDQLKHEHKLYQKHLSGLKAEDERLEEEKDYLCKKMENMRDLHKHSKKILQDENAKLRECVEFYAETGNWTRSLLELKTYIQIGNKLLAENTDLKQKLEASEAIADCFYEATKKVGW